MSSSNRMLWLVFLLPISPFVEWSWKILSFYQRFWCAILPFYKFLIILKPFSCMCIHSRLILYLVNLLSHNCHVISLYISVIICKGSIWQILFLAFPDKVKLENSVPWQNVVFFYCGCRWIVKTLAPRCVHAFTGILVERAALQCHLVHISWMMKIGCGWKTGCGCVSSVLWPTTLEVQSMCMILFFLLYHC